MVQLRPQSREIIAKVVYYGPPLGGKTTNLRTLFQGYPPTTRGELVVVPTGGDRTIFFDFLPIYAGELRGMQLRVQLYTVPGQVHYNATRQVVLRGVDGVVFVADSQREMMGANRDSWENLKENLLLQGLVLAETPHALQYNKRDVRTAVPVDEIDRYLNEYNAPFYEAVATQGIGVEETLQGIIKLVARSLRDRFKVAVPAGESRPGVVAIPPAPAAPPPPAPVPPGLRVAGGGYDGPTIVSAPRPAAAAPVSAARLDTSPFSIPVEPPAAVTAPPFAAEQTPAAASSRPAPPWANRELSGPRSLEEIEYEPPTSTFRPPAAPQPAAPSYAQSAPPPALAASAVPVAPRPLPPIVPPAMVSAPVVAGAPFEDPFDVTMPLPSRSVPVPRRIDDVFALSPVPPAQPVSEEAAHAAALAVQRVVPRAIAQYGEVRELELEVPVPSAWVGGSRMTLQLRLTLVPQEEKNSG